ncbi:hypothetical protein H2198_005728, partial [Neophaeococcomyces mojaviensis]
TSTPESPFSFGDPEAVVTTSQTVLVTSVIIPVTFNGVASTITTLSTETREMIIASGTTLTSYAAPPPSSAGSPASDYSTPTSTFSSTSSTSSSTSSSSSSESGLSLSKDTILKIGVAVAAILGTLVVGCIIFFVAKRRRDRLRREEEYIHDRPTVIFTMRET